MYSSLSDVDWPDTLDSEVGIFSYFGDNKKPGHGLHETRRMGNQILKEAFNALHSEKRENIPPFFIFTKGPSGRDVFFRGLGVPSAKGLSSREDLVAIWKTKNSQRFQNYRATFTILDVPTVTRRWVTDIHELNSMSKNAPLVWKNWMKGGNYRPLMAPRTVTYRSKQEQLPSEGMKSNILNTIIEYFKNHPHGEYVFERCAAEIAILMDSNIISYELTRRWRDGGRDATGKYRIGTPENAIDVDFALEAKCKIPEIGCGVKETSRLISRLRCRQFGIFIATSYVNSQAYKEIVEDGHPVIIVSGADIASVMVDSGYNSVASVVSWLNSNFPYE